MYKLKPVCCFLARAPFPPTPFFFLVISLTCLGSIWLIFNLILEFIVHRQAMEEWIAFSTKLPIARTYGFLAVYFLCCT